MKKYLLLFSHLILTSFVFAQDDICEDLYLFKEGYYMKQIEFNSKGKETGKTEFRVSQINRIDNAVTSTVLMKVDDGKKNLNRQNTR